MLRGFSLSSVRFSMLWYVCVVRMYCCDLRRASDQERLQHVESVPVRLEIDVRRRTRSSRVDLPPLTIHLDQDRSQESMIGSDSDDSYDLRCGLNRHSLIPIAQG